MLKNITGSYQEGVIKGVFSWKANGGDWVPFTLEQLSEMVVNLESDNITLISRVETLTKENEEMKRKLSVPTGPVPR